MKKLPLLFITLLILFSCEKDDGFTPVCDTPTNVASNSITRNSAIITWDNSNDSGTYTIEYGISGFVLGSGTTITETNSTTQLTVYQQTQHTMFTFRRYVVQII